MARKHLTAEEEARLIEAAEAASESEEIVLERVPSRIRTDASAVLSVRLPLADVKALRAAAAREGVSLSALLQQLVSSWARRAPLEMSISDTPRRLYVEGVRIKPSVASSADVFSTGIRRSSAENGSSGTSANGADFAVVAIR